MSTTRIDHYLAELQTALQDLPYKPAHDLYEGIAEELRAGDPGRVSQRIAELGPAEAIARELHAELSTAQTTSPRVADDVLGRSQTGLRSTPAIVGISLAVAIGAFVVPIAGWVLGIVLMWLSPVWSKLQKLVTTLSPLIAFAGTLLGFYLISGFEVSTTVSADSAFNESAVMNPLIPAPTDLVFSAILVPFIIAFISGIALLFTGMRSRALRP